jgi:alcohol dehydrogenase
VWAYVVSWCARTKVDLHLGTFWIASHHHHAVGRHFSMQLRSKRIDPKLLITDRFKLDHILDAHEAFGHAADTHAPKVIIEA